MHLKKTRDRFGSRVETFYSTPGSLKKACVWTDLLIGAVLVPGAAAPCVISKEMIETMNEGTVFVDISIDQGGCAETSCVTTLEDPIKKIGKVLHYGVCNMPAQAPRTSTFALCATTLPYIRKLADGGMDAVRNDPALAAAVNTHAGKLTNKEVGEAVGMDAVEFV